MPDLAAILVPIAAALSGGALGAMAAVRTNSVRIVADETRERRRWLASQRLAAYVRAHRLQRDLVFVADGILMGRDSINHAAIQATPSRYTYAHWLSIYDDLYDIVAEVRLLGAVTVADALETILVDWRASDIRIAIRGVAMDQTIITVQSKNRSTESEWWGRKYLQQASDVVELCRQDIESLSSNEGEKRSVSLRAKSPRSSSLP